MVGGKGQLIDDFYFGNEEASKVEKRIIQLAQGSVNEEADKFKVALASVMTQRIEDYLKVKYGSYEDKEVKNIVQSTEFKTICNEQFDDFKIDYRKFIEIETPRFFD